MKHIAFILLVLAWPCTLVHRFWNSAPVNIKAWFVFRPDISQDLQWYICDTGNMVSVLFMLSGALLHMVACRLKSYSIPLLLSALIAIQILDIFNYWFYFKQNEIILYFQGAILLITLVTIFVLKQCRR